MSSIQLKLMPEYSEIKRARKEFRTLALENNLAIEDECNFEIVIGELLANIIEHGVAEHPITISYFMNVEKEKVYFEISYQGTVVDKKELSKYLTLEEKETVEELSEHGRGIFIIHSIMDNIEYINNGNEALIKMYKNLQKS